MKTDELKKLQRAELKKWLQEADFNAHASPAEHASAEKLLQKLIDTPAAQSGEPPLGYEKVLLAKLRAQLPSQALAPVRTVAVERQRGAFGVLAELFKSPQMSWGTAGALAIFIAVFAYTQRSQFGIPSASKDLLVETASRDGGKGAQEWLASVGDTGIRARSGRGLSSLADELEQKKDQQAVEKALDDVAKSMGMNHL